MFKTVISFTSGIMCKSVTLFIFLLVCLRTSAYGQVLIDGGYYFGDLGPDEIIVPVLEGDDIVESAQIEDVIEGVGTVTNSSVPIYTLPKKNKESRIIRYAIPQEKFFVIMNMGDWYAIKMYNGMEGFIEKRNIKTVKVFIDESVTTNNMDKRLNYELRDIVERFNNILTDSVFLDKHKIIPRLTVTTTSKRNNQMVVTIEYSAVDRSGAIVPSKQANLLQTEMKKFIELLFMKMLPSKAVNYKIIIKKPVFSSNGQVLNMQGSYAELEIDTSTLEKNQITENHGMLFELLKCNTDKNILFEFFPN